MSNIENVKVRARVVFGSQTVITPYVLSFTVNKSRQSYATFDMQLKVTAGKSGSTGGSIQIYAGTDADMPLIFTGIIKKVTISPCWEDPTYIVLNMSGTDILSKLDGKTFSRPSSYALNSYAMITQVQRPAFKSGKFKYIESLPSLATVKGNEGVSSIIGTSNLPTNEKGQAVGSSSKETKEVTINIIPNNE